MVEHAVLKGSTSGGGGGLPLVLLHAFPFDGRMWEPQASALGAARSVLVPDLLGFGGTPLPDGPVGLDRQADAVAGYLEREGIGRAAVCGLSMGGYVALALAERHPGRIASLVLADTRATADSEATRANRTATAERLLREGVDWLVEEMLPRLLTARTLRDRPEVTGQVRRLMGAQAPASVAAAALAMRDRPDRTGVLRALECPVLVVVGGEDLMTTPEEARGMVAFCREGRLAVLSATGHLANLDNSDGFNEAVEAFLAGLDRR